MVDLRVGSIALALLVLVPLLTRCAPSGRRGSRGDAVEPAADLPGSGTTVGADTHGDALVLIGDVADTSAGTDGTDGTDGTSKPFDDVAADSTAIGARVLDADTFVPIQGAVVTTDPPLGTLLTNAHGEVVFDAADFPALSTFVGIGVRLQVARTGYVSNSDTVLVEAGKFNPQDIFLASDQSGSLEATVNPEVLQFSDADFGGGSTATKTVVAELVDAPGSGEAPFTASVPAQFGWVTVDPAAGVLTSTPRFINITVDRSGLGSGGHSGTVNLLVEGVTTPLEITVLYAAADEPIEPGGECAPSVGACLNDADQAKLDGQAMAAAESCGIGCVGQPSACACECIQEETQLSAGCSACYSAYINCVIDHCLSACAEGTDSASCAQCLQQSCDEDFESCTGI